MQSSCERTFAVDQLEPRRLLADTFNATSGNDLIEISATPTMTTIKINGTAHNSAADEINVNAGAGNDTFRVFGTRVFVLMRLRGEDGNDQCENAGTLDLDATYDGPAVFFGGAGTDTYFADNLHDTTPATAIDISRTSITRGTDGAISLFDEIEKLDYRDNDNSNRISFTNIQSSTAEIMNVTINGGAGNDTFTNIHSTATVGPWSTAIGTGGLTVIGGTGTDTLLLNNHNGGPSTHTLTFNTITVTQAGSDAGPLSHASIEAIDFDVTSSSAGSSDAIFIDGKPAATSLTFDSGGGNDSFTVGGGDLDSNGFTSTNNLLIAGAGTDLMIFDDVNDTSSDGTSSNYTFGNQSFVKGPGAVTYRGFENQRLASANGFVSGLNVTPIITINATESSMLLTDINGGAARGASVNVGNGSFAGISGEVSLDLNGGFLDRATISDSTAGGLANSYQVTSTFVRKGGTGHVINYTGVSQMTLSTSTVFDSVSVDSTPDGMSLSVFTNGGNDTLTFGGANVDGNIRGPVTFDGGAGTNTAAIFNTDDATLESQTLNGATFTDGFSHTFNAISSLTIHEGPGGTNLAVNAVAVRTTINGGNGDDTFDVGGGDLTANIPGNGVTTDPFLVINGGGGSSDSIRFNDRNDTTTGPQNIYQFQRTNGADQFQRLESNSLFVNWSNIEGVTLDANDLSALNNTTSASNVVDIATPVRINGHGGPDYVQILDSSVPVTVHTGLGDLDTIIVNADLDGIPVMFVVDQNDDVDALTINSGGTLRVTSGAVLTKTRLGANPTLTINGVLDLAGGAFLSRAGGPTPAQFRAQLIAGRNGGGWNGTSATGAINASLANASPVSDGVGYGLGSQIAPTSIGPFSIAAGDTLVRYTLDGDADLNQIVNLADFNRLSANFGQANRVWAHGDLNYDGLVNLADFNALAANFGLAAANGSPSGPFVRRPIDRDDPRATLDEML